MNGLLFVVAGMLWALWWLGLVWALSTTYGDGHSIIGWLFSFVVAVPGFLMAGFGVSILRQQAKRAGRVVRKSRADRVV